VNEMNAITNTKFKGFVISNYNKLQLMKENKNLDNFDIAIDDNNNIRILSADKYSASEKLKGESNKFVMSI
jgi:hypothetical protein